MGWYERYLTSSAERSLDAARERAQSTLAAHPILSAFLIQFIAFSAIPILIFGGWALAVILTVSLGALAFVVTMIVVLVGGALLGLLACLAIAAISAAFGTAFFISVFLFLRLVSNIRQSPNIRTGVQAFSHETQSRLTPAKISPASSNGDWVKPETEHIEHAPTYAAVTSE